MSKIAINRRWVTSTVHKKIGIFLLFSQFLTDLVTLKKERTNTTHNESTKHACGALSLSHYLI